MNESTESMGPTIDHLVNENTVRPIVASAEAHPSGSLAPQTGGCGCGRTAGTAPDGTWTASHVYAIGRIGARFPNLAIEKEFAQATGRIDSAGKPITRPSTPFCRSASTVIWCGNFAGC